MALSLKIKIRWGYVVAFLMLLISYVLIFYIIRKVAKEANSVSHSYAVINMLESIKAEVTDAETGVRGYVITNDTRFLKPYNSGAKNALSLVRQLKSMMSDNTEAKGKLDTMGELVNKRITMLTNSIAGFQRGGFTITDSMRAHRETNKNTMDSLRTLVRRLQEKEYTIMNDRNDKVRDFFGNTEALAVTSLLVALVTIIYSLIVYTRENRAKEEADETAATYSLELEARVNELNRVNIELEELKSMEKFTSTGRIARTIAHEVRNPLTNISLASEQIKEAVVGNSEADILLEMIGRNVNRINQLVSDLLNSTRFGQLEYTSIDINRLLDETLELSADRIELNHVRIEKYFEKGMPEVLVDKEKMKLALLNIIVNAIEAMKKDDGVLQIKTYKQSGRCVVEFKDNGAGMDDDTLHKLFEPYFTSKQKGNGLGLTNTQNIILNHKGNINVRSQLGKGSTFFVILNFESNV
jgi:signal transduction histidine kinase